MAPLSGVAEAWGPDCDQHYDSRSATFLPHRTHPFAGARPLHPHKLYSKPEDSPLYPRLDQERLCSRDFQAHSPILLKNVYGPEEEWTSSSGHRPLRLEQNAYSSQIQNGVCGSYRQNHHIPQMGDYHGPGRCLLQSPCGGGIPDLPGLHPFRSVPRLQNLRLPSLALRPLLSSLDLHEGLEANKDSSPSKGHDSLLLPRRFHESGRFSSSSYSSNKIFSPPSQLPRLHRKPQKIITHSKSILRIFRCNLESTRSQVVSSRSQGSKGSQPPSLHLELPGPVQERLREGNRVSEFHSSFSSSGQVVSTAHHSVDELSFHSSQQRFSSLSGQLSKKNPRSLVEPEGTFIPSTNARSKPLRGVDDRRLPLRLERGPSSLSSGGRMAPIPVVPLHELEGTPSYSSHSSPLSPSPEGQGSQGLVGQHDGSSLHSPSGFSSLPCSPEAGLLPSNTLSSSQHYPDSITHSGSSQCPSGFRFQEGPHIDRMVSGSPLLRGDLQSLGSPTSGLLCHPLQHPTMDIHLAMPGPSSTPQERNGPGLERLAVSIPLSPSADAPSGNFKVRSLLGNRVRDRSLLALPGLVRHVGTQSSLLHSPSPPTLPVPIYNSGARVLPQHFCLEPSRMEAITKPLRLQGWSNNSLRCAQFEHKDTTQGSYQRIWSRFLTFLDNQGIPHREVVHSTVFNFISHEGLDHKKAWRTCTTYKAALFHPLLYSLGLDIGWEGSRPEANTLMRGLHRLNPPPPSKMPLWDLSDLLYYLKSPVFEPLDHCSFTKCTQKTLALLLLASGRRISEISAISRLHAETSSKIVLLWLSSFTPKHFTPTFHPEHPSIHALDPAIEDRSLCPVRAWKIYKERRRMFTIKVLSHRFWILSRGDLSKQFQLLVRDSRKFVDKDMSVPMGPHQMRKLACSYSKKFWPHASSSLFTATGSKSMNVLSRCYIRDVPPLRYPCVLPLGTARVK